MGTRTVLILPAVALLLGAADPTWAQPNTGAWERWGITRPAPAAAEAGLIAAFDLLYTAKFDSARQAYSDLVRDYPQSAEAHFGLGMACRYLEERDSALAEVKTALALDPEAVGPLCEYASLLLAWQRCAAAAEQPGDSARLAPALEAARKAAAAGHRYSTYAHVMLWAHYTASGRLAEARQEMKLLGELGYYPPFLLDFGRNMMTGLLPDAILFTGGDHDTEPLLCLQATEGLRPDVTVVKLSFLWYPKTSAALRDSHRLPLSLSNHQLDELWSQPDSVAGKPDARYARMLEDVVTNALEQNRPVYFAATVDRGLMADWQEHLVREGIYSRVVPGTTADSVDVARLLANAGSWSLATAGREADWPACMSPTVRETWGLNIPYAAAFLDLARHYQGQGDLAQVDDCCRRAFGLIEHLKDPLWAGRLVKAWLDLHPDSSEAKELSSRYQ